MNSNPLVSIIVPCHNSEDTIARCLDSLLGQTMQSLEIVCVNNCSQDNTLSILQEYAEAYAPLIRVVDSPIAGAWNARWTGIEHAQGAYIGFLDGDDTAQSDFVEMLFAATQKNDAVLAVCGYSRINATTGRTMAEELCNSRDSMILPSSFEQLITINTAQWNKLYRADICRQIPAIEHPPTVLEDVCFNFLYYLLAEGKLTFVAQPLVNYLVHADSAMPTAGEQELHEAFRALDEVRDFYRLKGSAKQQEVLNAVAFLHLGVSMMFRIGCNSAANLRKAIRETRSYLDTSFPGWKTCPYLSASFALKRGGAFRNLWLAYVAFRLHLLEPALWGYRKILALSNGDIGW